MHPQNSTTTTDLPCPTCGATGTQGCRTAKGARTGRHAARVKPEEQTWEPSGDDLAPDVREQNRSVRRATRAVMRDEALRLRKAGYSFDAIGVRLGVAGRTAANWIREAVRNAPPEEVEEVRALELARLDSMLVPNLAKAVKGNTYAGEFVLKIMDRRAKYLDLDRQHTAGLQEVGSLLDRLVFGEEGAA